MSEIDTTSGLSYYVRKPKLEQSHLKCLKICCLCLSLLV